MAKRKKTNRKPKTSQTRRRSKTKSTALRGRPVDTKTIYRILFCAWSYWRDKSVFPVGPEPALAVHKCYTKNFEGALKFSDMNVDTLKKKLDRITEGIRVDKRPGTPTYTYCKMKSGVFVFDEEKCITTPGAAAVALGLRKLHSLKGKTTVEELVSFLAPILPPKETAPIGEYVKAMCKHHYAHETNSDNSSGLVRHGVSPDRRITDEEVYLKLLAGEYGDSIDNADVP